MSRIFVCTSILMLAVVFAPRSAMAQGSSATGLHTFTVTVMGGFGGSVDEDEGGYDNLNFQIGGSVLTEDVARIGVRVGQMAFSSEERLGNLLDVDLTYATVGGEYLYGEQGYQSGLFIGLGLYRLAGTQIFTAADIDTTKFGLTAGVTGEFDVSKKIGIVGELDMHALTSGEAQFFVTALAGVAFYFE